MTNTAEKLLFHTIISVQSMSESSLNKAREIFDTYIETRVLNDCTFDDEVWNATDEYANVGLHFNLNGMMYRRYYKNIFQLSFDDFVLYLKTFVAFTLGKNVLHSLQTFINDIKRIIKTNPEDIYAGNTNLRLATPNLCGDFFQMLPDSNNEEERESLNDVLDEYSAANYYDSLSKQRSLAQFDSYFLFNDILNDYWNSELPYEERLFFYPLYLWWQITGVIPLRPREFIVTNRECLEHRKDGYYLTLRRNNLKGRSKSVSYKITTDYYDETYKIPDKLGKQIQDYITYTRNYDATQINTLFVSDTHYKHWGQKKHSNSRYLTYINLSTILRAFYHEVIEMRYKLKVVYDSTDSGILPNEINYIHLGDTRHISLINIMAEGGTPTIAMFLAGHDNIEMSAHYYSNIKNLIECRTYRQYRLITKGNISYQVSLERKVPVKDRTFTALEDGGKCYSDNFKQGDISDCKLSSGPSGELGYCPQCKFYRKEGREFFGIDQKYQRQIENDCKLLSDTVALVRAGKGNEEDIGEALLRLKNSSHSYQEYYREKIEHLDKEGVNVWDERNKLRTKN